MKKTALITGITGQDGSFLARLLLEKGYEVHGMIRRNSSITTWRIDDIFPRLKLHYGDMIDSVSLHGIIAKAQPDEIYNMAAQSHVAVSFEMPLYTAQSDAIGVLNLLETVRLLGMESQVRICQASTSEMYGMVREVPQTEETPFHPRSPYGVAKVYGYWIVRNYREAYNMFATNTICFNHESEVRGHNFVTKKISTHVARQAKGATAESLLLGNLDALRDWGYAKEYVEAMWLALQHREPDDFVIATGVQHSVREFTELCYDYVGRKIAWRKDNLAPGVHEEGYDPQTGEVLVKSVDRYFRPAEVDTLLGNPAKARQVLGWQPSVNIHGLVKIMMDYDLARAGS